MLLTNFKMAWRFVRKGNAYSVINITGLAIGIACSMTIALYLRDEFSYDQFHRHHRVIYRAVESQDHDGVLHPVAATPGLLAEGLKRDYSEITQTCRISQPLPGILTLGDINIEPRQIIATDNSFFTMFDFRLLSGNPAKVLLEPTDIIITERVAEQLFGSEWKSELTLLGRQLTLNNAGTFTISGVTPDCPVNSHIQFDVILSMGYEQLRRPDNFTHWGNHTFHTYLQLDPKANAAALEDKLKNYLVTLSHWSKPTLSLQPLDEIYLKSHFDYGEWVKTSSMVYLRIFLAVGIVILLIAIFNFVNLSTARATQRAREVGVRKVIGGVRKQLIFQFLTESFMMTSLSTSLSVLLLFIFVPVLNEISGKVISVPFNFFFAMMILAVTLVVSALAGIYPAFLLSGFEPVKALKGFFRTGAGQLFRQSLVVTQFTLSVVLILAAVVIYSQLKFMQEKDLGFSKEQLIFLRLKNELFGKSELLKGDLQREASILSVASTSNNLIDVNASTHSISWEGKTSNTAFPLSHMIVDPDFLAATEVSLLSGRNFDPKLSSDSTSWLINETAAKRMGWTAKGAIGKSLRLWDIEGTVVGVVKDFHFRPLTQSIEPMLLRYWPGDPRNYRGLFVRAKSGETRDALEAIDRLYKRYESQTVPDWQFVDQSLDNMYRTEQSTGRTVLYFSIFAILVSCLGLFGLTTFSTAQRRHEIGVRKVLGASAPTLVKMLSGDFMILVGIALLIALPAGWCVMFQWLAGFAYHIEIEGWMILLTIGIVTVIALITSSYQAIKAAMVNPVHALKGD